ncbi:MAG: ACP S-malonyltransferase [candidate division NC10 bacterium]|nr:ACP S-malonyltransferase [candidate division NC10 bacterium]
MGRDLAESFPAARALMAEGSEVLGVDLETLCFKGPEETLSLTTNTQPAVLTVGAMAWAVVQEHGIRPDFVAGHSLGEYTALVAAGSLSFGDALRVVRRRGELMQEAVAVGAGAMAAVIGLGPDVVTEICREVAEGDVVEVANLNAPMQTVIAGHAAAVDRAAETARARGAKRVLPLPVSAPFHSSLMRPIAMAFAAVLGGLDIRDPRTPFIAGRDAEPKRTAGEVIQSLIEQLDNPVRWAEVVRRLSGEGIETFIELGPGKVLSGLIKRIDDTVQVYHIEDQESLEETLAAAALA